MQGVTASILIIFYTVMLTISWLFIHVLLFKVKNEWVIQRFNITQLQSGTVYPLRFFGASGRMGKKGTVTDKLERPFCYGQLGTSKKLFDPCDISRGDQQQELFAFYIEWQCPALVKEVQAAVWHISHVPDWHPRDVHLPVGQRDPRPGGNVAGGRGFEVNLAINQIW